MQLYKGAPGARMILGNPSLLLPNNNTVVLCQILHPPQLLCYKTNVFLIRVLEVFINTHLVWNNFYLKQHKWNEVKIEHQTTTTHKVHLFPEKHFTAGWNGPSVLVLHEVGSFKCATTWHKSLVQVLDMVFIHDAYIVSCGFHLPLCRETAASAVACHVRGIHLSPPSQKWVMENITVNGVAVISSWRLFCLSNLMSSHQVCHQRNLHTHQPPGMRNFSCSMTGVTFGLL